MEENKIPGGKQDMIDRKGAWIERMFDRLYIAVVKNPWAALLVLSIGLNFYVINLLIKTVISSKDEMVTEVRRSVKTEFAPIKAKQDSISNNVDSMGKKVDTSLINVNGTMQSVRQYIDKKIK